MAAVVEGVVEATGWWLRDGEEPRCACRSWFDNNDDVGEDAAAEEVEVEVAEVELEGSNGLLEAPTDKRRLAIA